MALIGVTGHRGFVGQHLVDAILRTEGLTLRGIDTLESDLSEAGPELEDFVQGIDVLVHLAGANRPESPEGFAKGNIDTTRNLLDAMAATGSNPLVIFASSIQAERDNPYGRSKLAAEELLVERAAAQGFPLAILRITNVFGAGCRPFYNSVVATFCHLVATGGEPEVHHDAELNLIPVNDVVTRILDLARSTFSADSVLRQTLVSDDAISVSALRDKLLSYRDQRSAGQIPDFRCRFDRELYATLVSYFDVDQWQIVLALHTDERGSLVEAFRFQSQGQVFFSTSKPGVTRGNHYHTRKTERFLVVEGEAILRLRKRLSRDIIEYPLSGPAPRIVEIPVGYVHNISNTGEGQLVLLVWANELFDPQDADTYFEPV
jgi:UDP-2-acetamido-2,6-beta-L-arabino-hexul-4-ose reductase